MKSNTALNIHSDRLKNLLKDMVDIYSPSGKEEEILEFTDDYLRKQGLNVVKQVVDEDRYNLLVLPEKTKETSLYFVGHLDTVTAYDLDNYEFREKGGDVFGLGTADMKSGCAAMIEAFTVLTESSEAELSSGLALLIDEEEDNSGAKKLVNEYKLPRVIIGEPTGLVPCLGHYSYLEVLLHTKGRRAHSAVPELGHNAINSMLKLLLQFTKHMDLQKDNLIYNIRDLTGFPGGFVVPDACEAWLDIHLPPTEIIDNTKKELIKLVKDVKRDIHDLDASIEFTSTYPGYRVNSHDLPVIKLEELYRRLSMPWEPQDFRSHSDGNIFWEVGITPIILGPGELEAAHTPEESVPFEHVVRAAQLYLDLALSLEK